MVRLKQRDRPWHAAPNAVTSQTTIARLTKLEEALQAAGDGGRHSSTYAEVLKKIELALNPAAGDEVVKEAAVRPQRCMRRLMVACSCERCAQHIFQPQFDRTAINAAAAATAAMAAATLRQKSAMHWREPPPPPSWREALVPALKEPMRKGAASTSASADAARLARKARAATAARTAATATATTSAPTTASTARQSRRRGLHYAAPQHWSPRVGDGRSGESPWMRQVPTRPPGQAFGRSPRASADQDAAQEDDDGSASHRQRFGNWVLDEVPSGDPPRRVAHRAPPRLGDGRAPTSRRATSGSRAARRRSSRT